MEDKWIYWLEEIGQEHNDLVGKKCANLGEMTKMGLPVPLGFSLSVKAEEMFLRETHADKEIKWLLIQFKDMTKGLKQFEELSNKLRQIVESKKMPKTMRETITSYYDQLCQKRGSLVPVSVRSAGTVSHPGQYETYLNVKGKEELLDKVIKVWSSIYNTRTIAALSRKGISLEESSHIGVCILEMVNARCSGVGFTCDPVSGDPSRIVIEANWGLGESVVSGAITPDKFILEKNTLNIIEKTIGTKQVQVVATDKGVIEKEIPPNQQSIPCLNDEEVMRIAELSRVLETHFGMPQDMEWVISIDFPSPQNIFLLQTRPVGGIKSKVEPSSTARIIDEVIKKIHNL